MLHDIFTYFKNRAVVSVFLLALMYCVFLFMYPDNFKFGLVVSFIFVGLFYMFTKNFFISLFITFTISSFFLFPAKTYTFEYASVSEYLYELLPDGIFETISFTVSDVFGILMVVYFIRERIKQTWNPGKISTTSILNTPIIMSILIAWFIYFAVSLFSSLHYSVFPTFSVNNLAQFGKMVIMFLGIIYLFYKEHRLSHLFYVVLLALLLFQSALGSIQFAQSVTSYGANKKLQTLDVEEKTYFSRIEGISMHANNHALAMALLVTLTLPFVLKYKKKSWWIITLLGALNIFLTQSRTIWLALIIVLLFLYSIHAVTTRNVIAKIPKKKWFFLLFLVSVGTLLFVIPRLQATGIFFTKDGGGLLRLKMLSEGWQLLQQAPWTGFGVGMGVRVFLDKLPNGYIRTFPFPIHLAYLQIALESGVPAALAFFFPLYAVTRGWILFGRKTLLHHHIGLSIVCSIIIVLVYFMAQPAYGRREFIYLGIILGLATTALVQKTPAQTS